MTKRITTIFTMVKFLVVLVVKMKVKVVAGKVYLPKEVRERVNLLEGGECEAVVVGDEIRIRPAQPESLSALRALKKPRPEVSIAEMVKAEVVEDA